MTFKGYYDTAAIQYHWEMTQRETIIRRGSYRSRLRKTCHMGHSSIEEAAEEALNASPASRRPIRDSSGTID
jgi:hypothetical protein